MSTATENDARTRAGDGVEAQKKMERVYAEINREVAALMSANDCIIFGPAEDFEYKAPLEDFQKTRQGVAS